MKLTTSTTVTIEMTADEHQRLVTLLRDYKDELNSRSPSATSTYLAGLVETMNGLRMPEAALR